MSELSSLRKKVFHMFIASSSFHPSQKCFFCSHHLQIISFLKKSHPSKIQFFLKWFSNLIFINQGNSQLYWHFAWVKHTAQKCFVMVLSTEKDTVKDNSTLHIAVDTLPTADRSHRENFEQQMCYTSLGQSKVRGWFHIAQRSQNCFDVILVSSFVSQWSIG